MTTLYEELGGKPQIEQLVTAFYRNVLSDPLLSPFFEETPIEKLKRMQISFFSVALGGPEPDVKVDLFAAHQGRGIQVKHLTRFTEHLMATLKDIGIDEDRAKRVYERIALHSNAILGDTSVDG